MKKSKWITAFLAVNMLIGWGSGNAGVVDLNSYYQLHDQYLNVCNTPSDINEHIPVLKQLATECGSVTEIGIRSMVSTWGVLCGLAENADAERRYTGIDLNLPPPSSYFLAKRLSKGVGIDFRFIHDNDMDIDIEPVDLLFIDSLHTYCHLTFELEKFSPKVSKYIAMHDTSYPWGEYDENCYVGDYSEYPEHINKTKRGLWLAVEDFLASHPEWVLAERRCNNHGFTILKRVSHSD